MRPMIALQTTTYVPGLRYIGSHSSNKTSTELAAREVPG
jgi:hypothetical protein